jgi:hypothetical protein
MVQRSRLPVPRAAAGLGPTWQLSGAAARRRATPAVGATARRRAGPITINVQIMCRFSMVHTSIYQYILVCTITAHDFIQIQLDEPRSALRRRFVSAAFLCSASATAVFLAIVCSIVRPPKRGLPRPTTATGFPHTHCCVAFHPQLQSLHYTARRKACIPTLADYVENGWS